MGRRWDGRQRARMAPSGPEAAPQLHQQQPCIEGSLCTMHCSNKNLEVLAPFKKEHNEILHGAVQCYRLQS
jgi:hypothetical protein